MDQTEVLERRIDRDRLIDRLSAMVQIPSINPFGQADTGPTGEANYASYLLAAFDQLGLQTGQHEVEPGRPNVWGVLGNRTGPSLALAGHTDTVGVIGYDDPFSGRVADGRVYGRGSCDMKAAFAAYLEVAQILSESEVDLNGSLIIAGLVDEEYAMLGSADWGQSTGGQSTWDQSTGAYPTIDQAILGEPTNLAVCSSHLGQFGLKIKTFGSAVHSSVPELGVNAIDKMGRVIEVLGDYRDDIAKRDPHHLCGTGRINPGVIRGGDIAAIVPDYCELEVDRRLPPGQTGADVAADLRSYLDPLASSDPDFRYELSEPTWNIAALDTPADAAIAVSMQQATAAVERPSELVAFPAATDGPNLGVPTIICGPGGLAQAHTTDEWVDIDEVVDAARIYLRTVLDLLA